MTITTCYRDSASAGPPVPGCALLQAALVTVGVLAAFSALRTLWERVRRTWATVSVVVVGAGPVGLLSALIAARCKGKVTSVVVYESRSRHDLLSRPQQLALDARSVRFLAAELGGLVDFDNIEGCWAGGAFYTRIGVFQEYLLDRLMQGGGSEGEVPVTIRLGHKLSRESLAELDAVPGRLVALVCDGAQGRAAALLGLSDEFTQHNCKIYGAVAALDRADVSSVPAPEIRVHNLTFDLNAYGNNHKDAAAANAAKGFHLKIYGSVRNRYLALAVPKCESSLVKSLKVVLDQSVMRNIFQVCFNTYKTDSEPPLSDKESIRHMKFSPRLFEIKFCVRVESAVYVEDCDIFVVAEGEAARYSNFHSGLDINLSLRGLMSLQKFLELSAVADREAHVLKALRYKHRHNRTVSQEFLRNGLKEQMFS